MVLTNYRSLHMRDHRATGHDLTGGALTSGPFCSRSPGSSTCWVGPGCFLNDGAPHPSHGSNAHGCGPREGLGGREWGWGWALALEGPCALEDTRACTSVVGASELCCVCRLPGPGQEWFVGETVDTELGVHGWAKVGFTFLGMEKTCRLLQ